jgi:lanosterol synthase
MHDAVDVMLSLHDSDGGFASYELIRGPQFLESVNPTEVFGMWMKTCSERALKVLCRPYHNYPECTTPVLTALATPRKYHPEY